MIRPKIALLVDEPEWAFGIIARNVVRYLSDRFEFTVVPVSYFAEELRAMLATRGHDLIHFFWRGHLQLLDTARFRAYVADELLDVERFYREFVESTPLTTGVHDHLFQGTDSIAAFAPSFHRAAGYYVISQRLDRQYRGIAAFPDPDCVVHDGVDLEHFTPRRIERLGEQDRPLVVGWAGNSNWGQPGEDHKGVRTVLEPAIQLLAAEGLPVDGSFADRARGMTPYREMPDYYAGIDVLVCASRDEGTPGPVLEAMACGVPVVSTDVGVVPEVFGPEQQQFILAERSVAALADALRELQGDPALRRRLSEENLESIRPWDWSETVQGFADFFERYLT